jgi:hypothetical protein
MPTSHAYHIGQYQSDGSEKLRDSYNLSIRFEELHELQTLKDLCTVQGSIRTRRRKKPVGPHSLSIHFEGLHGWRTLKVLRTMYGSIRQMKRKNCWALITSQSILRDCMYCQP